MQSAEPFSLVSTNIIKSNSSSNSAYFSINGGTSSTCRKNLRVRGMGGGEDVVLGGKVSYHTSLRASGTNRSRSRLRQVRDLSSPAQCKAGQQDELSL